MILNNLISHCILKTFSLHGNQIFILSIQITLPKICMFTASGGDQEQKASPPHLPEDENGQEDSESQGYQRGIDHETH